MLDPDFLPELFSVTEVENEGHIFVLQSQADRGISLQHPDDTKVFRRRIMWKCD